jgi:hypothetical protein
MNRFRFGDYVREAALHRRRISFNEIVTQTPGHARIHVHATEAALLRTYATPRFKEQARAVVPLAAYVVFQLVMLRQQVARSWMTAGLLAVTVISSSSWRVSRSA